MITLINLNPSIDKILVVEEFQYGGLNRAKSDYEELSGKAINAALVSQALGAQTECVGFMYRENGRPFDSMLKGNGITTDFLWADGAVRTNVKILDESTGRATEINTGGTQVTDEQVDEMLSLILRHAKNSDFLFMTGSLPPGCPADFYETIIGEASKINCRAALDASGEALKAGIRGKPFLVKPNAQELSALVGRPLESVSDVLSAAREIVSSGAEVVCASLSENGAIIVSRDRALMAKGVNVKVHSTVGAGDAMAAGLVVGFSKGDGLDGALRLGIACGTARVMSRGKVFLDRKSVEAIYQKVEITEVN